MIPQDPAVSHRIAVCGIRKAQGAPVTDAPPRGCSSSKRRPPAARLTTFYSPRRTGRMGEVRAIPSDPRGLRCRQDRPLGELPRVAAHHCEPARRGRYPPRLRRRDSQPRRHKDGLEALRAPGALARCGCDPGEPAELRCQDRRKSTTVAALRTWAIQFRFLPPPELPLGFLLYGIGQSIQGPQTVFGELGASIAQAARHSKCNTDCEYDYLRYVKHPGLRWRSGININQAGNPRRNGRDGGPKCGLGKLVNSLSR